jgi:plastocyanin
MRKIWHLSLTVLASVTLAGCGQTQANTSPNQEFTVAAKEFAFTPAALNVTGGTTLA